MSEIDMLLNVVNCYQRSAFTRGERGDIRVDGIAVTPALSDGEAAAYLRIEARFAIEQGRFLRPEE